MTNKELQQNALAISEIIAQSSVSSEEFQKTDTEISKAILDTGNFCKYPCDIVSFGFNSCYDDSR